MTNHPRNSCYLVIIAVLCMMTAAPVVPASEMNIALVVSRKIRPYVQVTDGILDQVHRQVAGADVFFLSPGDDTVTAQVADRLTGGSYDLAAAVGPEAAALVWETGFSGKKMYAALLDPDAVPRMPADACGISLRIPVTIQIRTLADTFPSLQRVGLLFDPEHNQWFFDAVAAAGALNSVPFEIVPLKVTARNQIAQALNDNLGRIDAVWMIPDQTVISEKVIQYVIKQALYANAGVIGYNAYFTRAGAFFSFEFDYRTLGRQAGDAIIEYLAGENCAHIPPVFETRMNEKMVEKLGLRVGETP
jgi:putative tryptophan/tyrosine transport system substrate-binding protein